MKVMSLLRTPFRGLLALIAGSLAVAAVSADVTRTEDVIYGRKHGLALTMDVFAPDQANGCGVVFMVSGGFHSSKAMINQVFFQAFLDRGYTVFAIVHGEQPKYAIPEIVQDIHRAIRFIRYHAADYGVDPTRLGIAGASSGGHLSVTIGTQGGPGDPNAKDPVDRESSAVAAVACFFPPTDFLNYGEPGEDAVGVGRLSGFRGAFGPEAETAEGRQRLGREISPVNFITEHTAPTLIIHGDADKLVPIQQAELFISKAKAAGVPVKLIVREGKDHGWPEIFVDLKLLADWFDVYVCPETGLEPATGFLPPAPAGQKWRLTWHDEFNGALVNDLKWNRLGDWKRRDGFWIQEDAYLDGQGKLVLRTRKDGDRFTCGAVNTSGKFDHAFGFYVARCRMPAEPGHWPAFWMMSGGVGKVGDDGRDGTEIDIMELPWRDGKVTMNLHWDGYGEHHKSAGHRLTIPELTDGFHDYALWWSPTEYVFYVDGKEVWRSDAGGVSQVKEYLKLTEEIGTWGGDITQATLPDEFLVEYVRVYDLVPE